MGVFVYMYVSYMYGDYIYVEFMGGRIGYLILVL